MTSRGRRGRSSSAPARYPRTARVNELLREVVAQALNATDDDPRLRVITVKGVETEPDLRHATVYFSALDEKGAAAALEERRRGLQAAVAREVRLKRTPQLAFVPDPAVASGRRIDDILRRLPDTEA